MTTILIMSSIFVLAGLVQGMIGFGFGMVSMSLLVMVVDIQTAVLLVAIFSLIVEVQILYKTYQFINWRHASFLVTGAMLGAPIGVYLLSHINPTILLFI